jgi:lambda family phage portal protein
VLDYYGIQNVATRELIESGEGMIRLRTRPISEGLPVPLQLQILEPEFCPETHTDTTKRIYHGVEFNGVGRRTTYWMYRQHPGDGRFNTVGQDLIPVPASTVLPHYMPLRAGQIRGVPWLVQALIKAKDFDEYDDAELVRKKNRASFTGVLTRPTLDETDWLFDPMTGAAVDKDAAGVPLTNFEAGQFMSLIPGEDIKLFDGDSTGAGYSDFSRQQLLGFSAGIGVPYEFLSGDMKDVNDRLMRVILNEYHRRVEQIQWLITVPQICVPVWEAFIDLAVLTGALSAPDYENQRKNYLKCGWNPQRWPYLNPLQDVEAAGKEIQYGLQSRTGAAAERGLVAEEIDSQNAEDKKRAESYGLTYETHTPKAATNPGQQNNQDDPEDEDDQQRQYNRVKAFRRLNARHYGGAQTR